MCVCVFERERERERVLEPFVVKYSKSRCIDLEENSVSVVLGEISLSGRYFFFFFLNFWLDWVFLFSNVGSLSPILAMAE